MGYVLITGASEGIGKEIARAAAKDRRDLILSARSKDKLEALATELRDAHVIEAHVILADLNEPDAAKSLWSDARAIGDIDVLVNNAGLGINGPFEATDATREEAVMQVNMIALTQLMKLAVQYMKPRGEGRILNVASTAGFLPGPKMAVYHASKAYVLSLSEAVAEELSGTGVTVTALCPGATKTEFFDGADMQDTRMLKTGLLMEASEVADTGWTALRAGTRIAVPGVMNKIFAFMPRLTPRRLLVWVVKQFYVRS